MERVGILGLRRRARPPCSRSWCRRRGSGSRDLRSRAGGGDRRPDDRVDRLAALYQPKKITHARIQFVDTVAAGQTSARAAARGPDLFSGVRNCDALLGVVRAFENPAVPAAAGVDPARDLRESRERAHPQRPGDRRVAARQAGPRAQGRPQGRRARAPLLVRLKAGLEAERPLRGETFDTEEAKLLRGSSS